MLLYLSQRASLSQYAQLTVSARQGEKRAHINSFCWDLDRIEKTNRWEILKINADKIKEEALHHPQDTTGTIGKLHRNASG